MATPVIGELRAFTADLERRRQGTMARLLETRRERLIMLARALPKPLDLIDSAQQRLDYVAHRLGGGLLQNLNLHQTAYARVSGRFSPGLLERPRQLKQTQLAQLAQRLDLAVERRVVLAESHARLPSLITRLDAALKRTLLRSGERLPELAKRLGEAMTRTLNQRAEQLKRLEQLRVSLDPDRPLNTGFARVNRADGGLVTSPAGIASGEALVLTFKNHETLGVIAHSDGPPPISPKPATPPPAPKPAPTKPKPPSPDQGSLF
jgi:exodeoxyribonuclease VII large subunit